MHLFERQGYWGRDRFRAFPPDGHFLKLQQHSGSIHIKARNQGLVSILPCECWSPVTWAIFQCFSRHISRELYGKWSTWYMNQCLYGIPVYTGPKYFSNFMIMLNINGKSIFYDFILINRALWVAIFFFDCNNKIYAIPRIQLCQT